MLIPPSPPDVTCGPSESSCKDGSCVATSAWCNQVIDCADASDEKGCSTYLSPDGEFASQLTPIKINKLNMNIFTALLNLRSIRDPSPLPATHTVRPCCCTLLPFPPQITATARTFSCWASKRKISSAATPPHCVSTRRGSAMAPMTAATTPMRPTARVSAYSKDAPTSASRIIRQKICESRWSTSGGWLSYFSTLVSHGQKCEEGHFACPSGNCISSVWLCDGQKDCEDGADEFQCGKWEILVLHKGAIVRWNDLFCYLFSFFFLFQ